MTGPAKKPQGIPAPVRTDGRIDDAQPVFTAATGAGAGAPNSSAEHRPTHPDAGAPNPSAEHRPTHPDAGSGANPSAGHRPTHPDAGAGANPSAGHRPTHPDSSTFRDAIGRFATGVTIVTASGPGGPAGMTTNAVTSVSLDPLLLLVCFDHSSRTLDVVRESGRFAVSVLGVGDEELAAIFASKAAALEKFEAVTGQLPGFGWGEAEGVPVLESALAWLVCDVAELHAAGDHTIGIGEVIAMATGPDREPLVFYAGRYTTIPLP